jgi:hypothetical protein
MHARVHVECVCVIIWQPAAHHSSWSAEETWRWYKAPHVNPFCRFSDPRQNSQAHSSTNCKQTHPNHSSHQNRSLLFHIHSLHHHKTFPFTYLNTFMEEQQTWNFKPSLLYKAFKAFIQEYSSLPSISSYFSSVHNQPFDFAPGSSSCMTYK